ncbi:MAG: hypothetical protein L0H96_09270 [Humibacillus sp.]|nr:hypothetical protein [Humibacillus sp.]MDN5777088.1 hypothetical protein [Humibacillus sp.]
MYRTLDGSEVAFTYAFPLPFQIPVPDGFAWDATFADWQFCPCQGQATHEPVVTATVQRLDVPMAQLLPGDTVKAMKAFYGHDLETYVSISNSEVPYARSYVSLETPPFLLTTDPHDCATASREDAWHFWLLRSVPALNAMIRAAGTVTQDHSLVEVDYRDLGHLVIQGARLEDNSWVPLGPMFLNLETGGPREPLDAQWAFGLEIRFFHWANDYPFVKARFFRQKAANDRFIRGDLLSAIISLNTAAEVMLFDAYRLILIDQGAQTEEGITDQAHAMNFSALVKTTLPQLLGGNWRGPALTAFWDDLYKRRNSAVHAGVIPAENDVLAAEEAFDGLETFLGERLTAKWKTFPRALMCLLGEDLRGSKLAAKADFLALKETVLADMFYWLAPDRRPGIDPSLRNRVRFP